VPFLGTPVFLLPRRGCPTTVRTLHFVWRGIPRTYENKLREFIRRNPRLARVNRVEFL